MPGNSWAISSVWRISIIRWTIWLVFLCTLQWNDHWSQWFQGHWSTLIDALRWRNISGWALNYFLLPANNFCLLILVSAVESWILFLCIIIFFRHLGNEVPAYKSLVIMNDIQMNFRSKLRLVGINRLKTKRNYWPPFVNTEVDRLFFVC